MDQITKHILKKGEKPRVQDIQDKMIENLLKHEQERLAPSTTIENIETSSKRAPVVLETNESENHPSPSSSSKKSDKRDPASVKSKKVGEGGIRVGSQVQVTRKCWGVLKWIGFLPDKDDGILYYGIALDQALGKNNGMYKGKRLFRCKSNCGIFVRFNRLVSTCDVSFENF